MSDEWPAPAASAPELPPIAAKADDLEAIKKAVDDAASVGGGLWLSYLLVLFYLATAAGAVSHEDLFFERSLKLPFLNIELPLLAFCFLAPILFVIVHTYTLVHLVFLTDKAKRYHQALHEQMGDHGGLSREQAERRSAKREGLRRQLPSNIFIQFLAGPADIRNSAFGWLLRAIAWITIAAGPVLLLLLLQIRFLPFHRLSVTWAQRIALGFDLLLLWWLWRKILSGRWTDTRQSRGYWTWAILGVVVMFAAILFSVAVVTFPGEWQEAMLPNWQILPALADWGKPATETDENGDPRTNSFRGWAINARKLSLHDWLFDETSDSVSRRRLPFSNTLVLTGLNVYEGLGIDDPDKVKCHDYIFRARGRDLKGATFDLANLPKIDFEGADLEGASLERAQLQGASLRDAQLEDAFFDGAQLQVVSFDGAQLQGASLLDTQLQGSSFDGAQLQGASLDGAQLQGASLDGAQLQGGSLHAAQLQGASLVGADLRGASLEGADLRGASLVAAQLQGASLKGARLQGASLNVAQLQGVSLEGATIEATDLSGARLWRTIGQTAASTVTAVQMSGDESWKPEWTDRHGRNQPWDDEAYHALRTVVQSLPSGDNRDEAFKRIQSLDCSSSDMTLDSCDVKAVPPPEATTWREALEAAHMGENAYTTALAKTLRDLVCLGSDDAIYVLRGAGFRDRLLAAHPPAPDLIDDLMNKESKDCPVSAALTGADRANLLAIKQEIDANKAGQKSVPSDAPYSP